MKAVYHIIVSSAEAVGGFNTDFHSVNLHHPTAERLRRRRQLPVQPLGSVRADGRTGPRPAHKREMHPGGGPQAAVESEV